MPWALICRALDARQTRILNPREVNQNTQRDLASLAGCIYREKSVESSSVTADPSAIGQIGRRPAHLHGTRANDSEGAVAIAHGRLARYTQILYNADHVFVERLAAEFNAAALAIERAGHELNLPSEERLMFAASFTVAPASMVVGNSSAEATVTASLAFATRASPDRWHSAPFSAFCASAASHSFCRSAAASAASWPTTGSAVIIELKTD